MASPRKLIIIGFTIIVFLFTPGNSVENQDAMHFNVGVEKRRFFPKQSLLGRKDADVWRFVEEAQEQTAPGMIQRYHDNPWQNRDLGQFNGWH